MIPATRFPEDPNKPDTISIDGYVCPFIPVVVAPALLRPEIILPSLSSLLRHPKNADETISRLGTPPDEAVRSVSGEVDGVAGSQTGRG